MKKKTDNAIKLSKEILKENHMQIKDIPFTVGVAVTGKALAKKLELFETDVKMTEEYPRLQKNDKVTIENAIDLLHAIEAYERVCLALKETNTLPEEVQERLKIAKHNAQDICNRHDVSFSMLSIRTYAASVLYYAVQEFCSKDLHTAHDAAEIIAARAMKSLIEDLYSGYDVLTAEERIHDIVRYNHYKSMPAIPDYILLATMPSEGRLNQDLFIKAAEEIDRVINHTEDFGYSLNYIRSGRTKYSVFRWKAEKESPEKDNPIYNMWAEDIGEYDTPEEAAEAAEKDGEPPAEIEAYDPEEMWAIVDTEGRNPTNMIYPTKLRAVVFLLGLLGEKELPNWTAWERLLDEKRRGKT